MSSAFAKIDNIIETFLSTLKRFPLSSLSAFLFTVILIALSDQHYYAQESNQIIASKVAFVATLALPLFTALRLLSHRRFVSLLGIPIIIAYYYFLPHNIDTMSQQLFLRHALLILALVFMMIWAPFVGHKSDNATFWQWTQEIVFGLITALFFSLVIYLGVAGAIYAVSTLFHIEIRHILYLQLSIFSFGLVGTLYFLSQIPKHPLFLEIRPYSKVKRIFSRNILGGFALLYFIILYAYSAKILLTQAWPSGTLAWIIVAFSIVAIVTFLFWTPFLNKKSTLLQRFIWLIILLQTLMLAWSLYLRVEEYGITFNRYYVGVFGAWLLLMSLYFILFGKAEQKWLFFVATLFIVFSQFGLYSAYNVTQKEQSQRLMNLLKNNYPLSEKLELKTRYQISGTLQYLNRNFGEEVFKELLPVTLEKYKKYQQNNKEKIVVERPYEYYYDFPHFATHEFGFAFVDRWRWMDAQQKKPHLRTELSHYFHKSRFQNLTNIKGYHYLLFFHGQETTVQTEELNLTITLKENQLTFHENNATIVSFDLSPYVTNILSEKTVNELIPKKISHYKATQKGMTIKLIPQQIVIDDKKHIDDLSGQILLKIEKEKKQ